MKICLSFLLFLSILSHAQPFQFRADLAPVTQSGYHRVVLPPAVVGRLNNALGDVRLYDNQGREVPYLLNRAIGNRTKRFVAYPVVRRSIVPGKSTTLIVKPTTWVPRNTLTLLVKNAGIRKFALLRGSNDGQQWFGIENDILIEPLQSANATDGPVTLNFPLSDYVYYRLDLPDSLTAPLNILQIGGCETIDMQASYMPISAPVIQQTDNKVTKQSDIRITFSQSFRIDRLVVKVLEPAKFQRSTELGVFRQYKTRRSRTERRFEILRELTLLSTNTYIWLPSVQTAELHLLIENEDNQPLTIGGIQAYQLTTHLTANLTANTPYYLLFSAANVPAPRYDLATFQASIPANAPEIGLNKIGPVEMDGAAENSFWSNRWLIWVALVLGLAVLGLLSFRMVREMK